MRTTTNGTALKASLGLQRKAAITRGGAFDYVGQVTVARKVNFDLGRTIFSGLTGVARKFMVEKLTREATWDDRVAEDVKDSYALVDLTDPAPLIDERLINFMVEECDFSMEHADGSFFEHLVFCHDYAARHYPEHSPNVALLHSILGTATNMFAMTADKIPELKALLTDFEALQIELFPSVLRLFYNAELLDELEQNMHRISDLQALHCHRVIDNAPLTIDADNLWINLNYHLVHFVDSMPAANWSAHRNDPLLQMFERLSNLLDCADKRQANVTVSFPETRVAPVREARSLFGRVSGRLPAALTMKLARKSIQQHSEQAGHDLSYRLDWA